MIEGDNVKEDEGKGLVKKDKRNGSEEFEEWMDNERKMEERGIDKNIKLKVGDEGFYKKDEKGLGKEREGGKESVIEDKGKKGEEKKVVIEKIIEEDKILESGRIKN